MSSRVSAAGHHPAAHPAQTHATQSHAAPTHATQTHAAAAHDKPKSHAPAAPAAPTPAQAEAAMKHVSALAANHAVNHAADHAAGHAVKATGSASAAARAEVQNRIRAAHYAGRAAEVASAAKVRKTSEATITRTRDGVVLDAGSGNDNIHIFRRKNERGVVVRVNGKNHTFNEADARRLTVRAGGGNDRLYVGRGVHVNLTLSGGSGNDRITGGDGNDVIKGGAGRDYINGWRGNDSISGGDDYDVLYGSYGGDRISGGRGNDCCEGGTGHDLIDGGDGRDIVSGGRGNDWLEGGAGSDRLYAGAGHDLLHGSSGRDTFYAQKGADLVVARTRADRVVNVEMKGTPGASIKVAGSGRFRDRVNADLDLLRSSPAGQRMLRSLDFAAERGYRVKISETHSKKGNSTAAAGDQVQRNARTGKAARGEDAAVYYDPERTKIPGKAPWEKRAPIVGLYHEMVHAYNMVTGTMQPGDYRGAGLDRPRPGKHVVPNSERQAVGLPIDHDLDPRTPMRTVGPRALTENALREEMGLPLRPSYRLTQTDGK